MLRTSLRTGDSMKQWTLALFLTTACGCSIIVDGAIRDPEDGGVVPMDAPMGDAPGNPCAGAEDGDACGTGLVCVDEECVASECGDDVTDPANNEDCDDGNEDAGDGCENDCTFTCEGDNECDDGLPCNGTETCGDDHTCGMGTPLGAGDPCTQPDTMPGVCRGDECVAAGCGNMLPDFGEECDDGNMTDGDGCDADCTFTCESDTECDDMSVCSGTETCNVAMHVCVAGTPMTCDDSSPCTANECEASMGCIYPLIDMDMDGHASQTLGACGTDCNDMRADVSPDAAELCGDALDSDCDGSPNPASTPVWYRDCDDDGYAVVGAVTMTACSEPPGVLGCTGWTTRVPISGNRSTFDCNDSNRDVRPNQTTYYTTAISGASSTVDFDYDCDIMEERRYTATGVSTTASCYEFGTFGCIGSSGWTGSSAPVCGASAAASICAEVRGVCTRTNYSTFRQSCL